MMEFEEIFKTTTSWDYVAYFLSKIYDNFYIKRNPNDIPHSYYNIYHFISKSFVLLFLLKCQQPKFSIKKVRAASGTYLTQDGIRKSANIYVGKYYVEDDKGDMYLLHGTIFPIPEGKNRIKNVCFSYYEKQKYNFDVLRVMEIITDEHFVTDNNKWFFDIKWKFEIEV